jgi:PhnB protein
VKSIDVYLTFNGNCREAMEFYKSCFGGELYTMKFSEAPPEMKMPKEAKDRILHSKLTVGSVELMASDNMPGLEFRQGNNFSVCVECSTREEQDMHVAAISRGGKVTMPLQDTFWGARFGMVTDKFGINWMFSLERPKK